MKNGKGEVLGVLQLINWQAQCEKRKLNDFQRGAAGGCTRFPERAVRLGLSLASQAAVGV